MPFPPPLQALTTPPLPSGPSTPAPPRHPTPFTSTSCPQLLPVQGCGHAAFPPPPASSSAHRVCARRGCYPTRAPVTCSSHLRANSAGRVGGGGRGRSGVWARLLPAPVQNSTAEAHLHEARERPHPNLPWCGAHEARLQNAAPRPPRHPAIRKDAGTPARGRFCSLLVRTTPPAPTPPPRAGRVPEAQTRFTHLGNGHPGPPVWAPRGPREPPGEERSDIPVGSQVVSSKEQRLGPHGA